MAKFPSFHSQLIPSPPHTTRRRLARIGTLCAIDKVLAAPIGSAKAEGAASELLQLRRKRLHPSLFGGHTKSRPHARTRYPMNDMAPFGGEVGPAAAPWARRVLFQGVGVSTSLHGLAEATVQAAERNMGTSVGRKASVRAWLRSFAFVHSGVLHALAKHPKMDNIAFVEQQLIVLGRDARAFFKDVYMGTMQRAFRARLRDKGLVLFDDKELRDSELLNELERTHGNESFIVARNRQFALQLQQPIGSFDDNAVRDYFAKYAQISSTVKTSWSGKGRAPNLITTSVHDMDITSPALPRAFRVRGGVLHESVIRKSKVHSPLNTVSREEDHEGRCDRYLQLSLAWIAEWDSRCRFFVHLDASGGLADARKEGTAEEKRWALQYVTTRMSAGFARVPPSFLHVLPALATRESSYKGPAMPSEDSLARLGDTRQLDADELLGALCETMPGKPRLLRAISCGIHLGVSHLLGVLPQVDDWVHNVRGSNLIELLSKVSRGEDIRSPAALPGLINVAGGIFARLGRSGSDEGDRIVVGISRLSEGLGWDEDYDPHMEKVRLPLYSRHPLLLSLYHRYKHDVKSECGEMGVRSVLSKLPLSVKHAMLQALGISTELTKERELPNLSQSLDRLLSSSPDAALWSAFTEELGSETFVKLRAEAKDEREEVTFSVEHFLRNGSPLQAGEVLLRDLLRDRDRGQERKTSSREKQSKHSKFLGDLRLSGTEAMSVYERARRCALLSWKEPRVLAACALFLDLFGIGSETLRIDVKVARRIHGLGLSAFLDIRMKLESPEEERKRLLQSGTRRSTESADNPTVIDLMTILNRVGNATRKLTKSEVSIKPWKLLKDFCSK